MFNDEPEIGRTLKGTAKELSEYEKKVKEAWKGQLKKFTESDMYYHEEPNKTQEEIVVKPSHYIQNFEIEPITFIMKDDLSFWLGNVIKYAIRAGQKLYPGKTADESAIIDLEKTRRYAEMRINQLKGKDIL